ncbi:MAG: hypothetical protein HQL96_13370 [Magnetococcales bacterium]|nr:hypothetical protein [Magnetococcales bacterium]
MDKTFSGMNKESTLPPARVETSRLPRHTQDQDSTPPSPPAPLIPLTLDTVLTPDNLKRLLKIVSYG